MKILNQLLPYILLLLVSAASGQTEKSKSEQINEYYQLNTDNGKPSKSNGTEGKGTLENGKLVPFSLGNFRYFDTLSYLKGRAFLNDKVLKTILDSYKDLQSSEPDKKFMLMECSEKKGGKLFPHRTHQNGMSADFMMPLKRNNKQYLDLDTTGVSHYWLEFDDQGRFTGDTAVAIDFNLVAKHILILEKNARKNNLKIKKVILKISLKDELFRTTDGKKLSQSNVYFAESLPNLIDSLHDDHFHVDFAPISPNN
jgi:penicillin-insensitive murein endopeptidase